MISGQIAGIAKEGSRARKGGPRPLLFDDQKIGFLLQLANDDLEKILGHVRNWRSDEQFLCASSLRSLQQRGASTSEVLLFEFPFAGVVTFLASSSDLDLSLCRRLGVHG